MTDWLTRKGKEVAADGYAKIQKGLYGNIA
jgi:hypothetical protein